MTEFSDGQIQTTTLDHLGLVAAICQDLKIAQRIDDRLSCDSQRKVSPGRAAVAMILNGLGFTNSPYAPRPVFGLSQSSGVE